MTCGIYTITSPSGRVYVGQSVKLASVAQEAYAAGQEAERQQKQPVQVDDADIIKST